MVHRCLRMGTRDEGFTVVVSARAIITLGAHFMSFDQGGTSPQCINSISGLPLPWARQVTTGFIGAMLKLLKFSHSRETGSNSMVVEFVLRAFGGSGHKSVLNLWVNSGVEVLSTYRPHMALLWLL